MKYYNVLVISVVLFTFTCGKYKKPELSVKKYAAFKSFCLVTAESLPKKTGQKKEILANAMVKFNIDSTKIVRFLDYYKKHPNKWLEVEVEIQNELNKLLKRRENVRNNR